MREKKRFLLPVTVCLTALFLLPFHAEAGLMQRTLKGVDRVFVSVEGTSPSVEKLGLNAKKIKIDVEKMLQEAGIRILTPKEWKKTENRPCLSVEIKTYMYPGRASEGGAIYAYTVDVRFFQTVSLVRDPLVRTMAPTWISRSVMGISNEKNLQVIQDYIGEFVAHFIRDYKLANVKKPGEAPAPIR